MSDKTYIRRSKHDKENPYMMLRRETAQNKGLSYEALGLLTYLLSKPDNWQVKIGDLQRPKLCGRDKARSLLEELVEKGYAKREEQGRNSATGQFEYGDYEVAETPIFLEPHTENPYTVNPSTVEPYTVNPTLHSNELDKVEKETYTPDGVSVPTTHKQASALIQVWLLQNNMKDIQAHYKNKGYKEKASTLVAMDVTPDELRAYMCEARKTWASDGRPITWTNAIEHIEGRRKTVRKVTAQDAVRYADAAQEHNVTVEEYIGMMEAWNK